MSPRAILLAALLLAGCNIFAPYKVDIQQGNVVTQEMLARLQPGMTRSQVRFALGTPLVVDPFRADRWDYVYFYTKQGVVTEQRRIVVVFKDDKLARIEGNVVPAGAGGAKTGSPAPTAGGAQPEQR
jgi:outer membrane protein assembly factor BamE